MNSEAVSSQKTLKYWLKKTADVLFYICLSWVGIFITLFLFGKCAGLSLRSRFLIVSFFIIFFGIPVFGHIRTVLSGFSKGSKTDRAFRADVISSRLFLILYVLLFGLGFYPTDLYPPKEISLSSDILLSTSPYPNHIFHDAYYRSVTFLYKRECAYDDRAVVQAVLQNKYGEPFYVSEKTQRKSLGAGLSVLTRKAYPLSDSSLVFQVQMYAGAPPFYTDDYSEVLTGSKANENEAPVFEETAADRQDSNDLSVPSSSESSSSEPSSSEPEEWAAPSTDEYGLLTPEGAYEKLYQAIFEPQGDRYECTYNAKGNFYAILEDGAEQADGQSVPFRRTVVYDRESKNGKCQLFVAYKEYDGGQNTRILEFYAVNKETGEVTPGNKTAWDQVASKEYQKATGEK